MEEQQKAPHSLLSVGLLLVIAAAGLLIVFRGVKNSAEEASAVEMTASPTVESATTGSADPVDVVNGVIAVEAGSFYYKPNLIRVKKGEKVKLTLNSVSMMHDFNIDELGIKVPVTRAGSSSSVEFVANQVGEFEFYCSVGNHRAMGQVGKLIVTE